MAALKTLRSINKQLAETQQRLATGYRINKASDNPAYWSIATTMRSDDKALSAVQDALGLGAAKLDTAYAAMDSAISVVDADGLVVDDATVFNTGRDTRHGDHCWVMTNGRDHQEFFGELVKGLDARFEWITPSLW